MPLYMLMYPFLVVASYYAIVQHVNLASPNEAFFTAVVHLLPPWLVGLVAAGASLSGLLVLAGICLAIGPVVTRNLLPHVPESRQKTGAKAVIGLYLLLSIGMTLATPNLMLTLINMTYYGVTQFFPGVIVIVFGLRVSARAIGSGMLAGQVLAVILYVLKFDLAGLNLGLVCLAVNVLAMAAVDLNKRRSQVHAQLTSK
jgi:SSS family solute:Na+ symporter